MKITTRRGLPLDITFTITDDGDPLDLTDSTIELAFKDVGVAYAAIDGEKVLTKTIDDITDGTDGIVVFELTSSDMDIPAGKYLYDIYISTVTQGDFATSLDEIRITPRGA